LPKLLFSNEIKTPPQKLPTLHSRQGKIDGASRTSEDKLQEIEILEDNTVIRLYIHGFNFGFLYQKKGQG
jgi:hypothetical protein